MFKVYIDGVEDPTTDSWSVSMRNNDTMNLYIGYYGYGGVNYFDDMIDEVQVWNRALSPDEVNMLYETKVTYPTQTNFSFSS